MHIEWNKVTWYSKLCAVILALLILVFGIYIGEQIQQIKDSNKTIQNSDSVRK